MMGSLVVETVYPAAGLYRMGYDWVRRNECILRELCEGKCFWGMEGWSLTAGSQAEGLAIEDHWGHRVADRDYMYLCSGDLAVYILPPGQQTPKDATLLYTTQQCPPGYTRLQVLNKDRLLRAIVKHRSHLSVSAPEVQQCVFSEGGQMWLHSRHTLEVMQGSLIKTIIGPAGQYGGGLFETVHTLVCSGPHPAMASYKERPRKHWPSTVLLDALMKQPILLVMVGPKDAQDSSLMFRISCSTLELTLISSLDIWLKQGYVCFKYTFKAVLKSLRPQESVRYGRSQVGSYHLKTVFLRHLEEHPPQQEGSPFQLALDLCEDLQHYLLMGCLPHYFLPECDLLRTVGEEERKYAMQAVGKVIAAPLAAILQSPSKPKAIYHHSPNRLVRCFSKVFSLPSCPERRECLRWLLRRLDKHREGLHRKQVKTDGVMEVSGRPELVRLADCLQGKNVKHNHKQCYSLNDCF